MRVPRSGPRENVADCAVRRGQNDVLPRPKVVSCHAAGTTTVATRGTWRQLSPPAAGPRDPARPAGPVRPLGSRRCRGRPRGLVPLGVDRPGPRGLVIALVAAAVAITTPRPVEAKRKGPTQIVPTKQSGKARREARRAEDDRSEGGTRRGALELTLGSVVAGTSGLLVGRGIWEIVQARRTDVACDDGAESVDCNFANPGRQGRIAAGLSFGFAGVLGVAAGFLLVRGVRIHRDYREHRAAQARVSIQPWASVRQPAGGVSLQLRF